VPKSPKPEKPYCLRRPGVGADDSACPKSDHQYIQSQERNAVRLHEARAAQPIGSDGCVAAGIFTK